MGEPHVRRPLSLELERRARPRAQLGRCRCPECGFPDAEVRLDKNRHPYRYCGDCTAQYFTRGDPVKVRNLIASIRPVTPRPASPPAPRQVATA